MSKTELRTIAYVDGYNLYYSALSGTNDKWLDLFKLTERILRDAYTGPPSRLSTVKFFTSPVKSRYAKDTASPERQMRYHNALRFGAIGNVEFVEGYHSIETKKALDVEDRRLRQVEVLEEKQTDVNIGLHMYRDAARGETDHCVLISNDSDLEPALQMLADDYPSVLRGVVFPTREENALARRSGKLSQRANWTRRYLRTEDLSQSQLPRSILNRRGKAILRPKEW